MPKASIDVLRKHALRVHEDVAEMLNTDSELEEDAVHGLRVAAKEVRALWQLLKPVLDDARAEQAIASLGEAAASLSEVRDQYVTGDTLLKLCRRARGKDARQALENALKLLQAGRHGDATRVAASRQLRESWADDSKRWQTLDLNISQTELISEGYGRLYRKAYRHSLRKWVKYLALTLPLLGNSSKLEPLYTDVTRLGKKLGRLHDLETLLTELATLAWPNQDTEDPAYVRHLVRREMGSVLEESALLAVEIFSDKPRKFIRELKRQTR